MKKTILIFILLAAPLFAERDLRFYWKEYTHAEIDGFKLYVQEDEEWDEVATTNFSTLEYKGKFPDKNFALGFTVFRILSNGQIWESPKATLVIPEFFVPPEGIKVDIIISIQTSKDLDNFEEIATITFPVEKYQKGFFRVEQK